MMQAVQVNSTPPKQTMAAKVENVGATRYIGIILFDKFEELDAIGPLEVFGLSRENALARYSKSPESDEGQSPPVKYDVITITIPGNPGGKQVRGANGLTVVADYAADDSLSPFPALDAVLVPGGEVVPQIPNIGAVCKWLGGLCQSATWVTSVCNGVFLLHGCGYAKGKRVATHFLCENQLEKMGDVTVVRGQRWVVDGNLVTSQGVSAGIDMALWLVGQLYSPERARGTQKLMQYHPSPFYTTEGEEQK